MDYLELNILLSFPEGTVLWENMSSGIRGIWGKTLKKSYCLQKQISCEACPFANCTYFQVFEKRFTPQEQYHPYIIQTLRTEGHQAGIAFKFFGYLCAHIDKMLISILQMEGQRFYLRNELLPFSLQRIMDISGREIYKKGGGRMLKPAVQVLAFQPEAVGDVRLNFVTPLRLKEQRQPLREFDWQRFWEALLRRVSFFDAIYNRGKLGIPERMSGSGVKVLSSETQWCEQYRKSSRQNTKMSLGGITGSVCLGGLSAEQYGIIKLGSYLHAGRQTAFGNGKYKTEKI